MSKLSSTEPLHILVDYKTPLTLIDMSWFPQTNHFGLVLLFEYYKNSSFLWKWLENVANSRVERAIYTPLITISPCFQNKWNINRQRAPLLVLFQGVGEINNWILEHPQETLKNVPISATKRWEKRLIL